MTTFEETLSGMTTPEVPELKHQALLADAIARGKSTSVLSLWWISIPIYVTALFLMKSAYMRNTTLLSNLHEFFARSRYLAAGFFVVAPAVLIVMNAASIRRIYFLSGSPRSAAFIRETWFQAAVIVASLIVLFIYFV